MAVVGGSTSCIQKRRIAHVSFERMWGYKTTFEGSILKEANKAIDATNARTQIPPGVVASSFCNAMASGTPWDK